MQLGGLEEHCKLPNRFWGRAPAEIKFGAFFPYNDNSLYGDKASISRFIFFFNRPFPFLPA